MPNCYILLQMGDLSNVYFLAVMGVIALVGNGFILLTGIVNPRLRKSSADVMTLSLSLADLCMGFVTVPCHVLLQLHVPRKDMDCLFTIVGFLGFHLISIVNLFMLTLDKFVAIRFPFAYQRLYTPRRAVLLCAAGWLLGEYVTLTLT